MQFIKQSKPRTQAETQQLSERAADIIARVRTNGDAALQEYNQRFDGNNSTRLRISPEEIRSAYAQVAEETVTELRQAAANIRSFAEAQKATMRPLDNFQPQDGIYLGHRILPVSSCCCYVPGGLHPLYSTALMLAIPAKIAGVSRIAACSPARKNGLGIDPITLVAMDLAGVDEIYMVGGAQAIAAFSYGTESISPVDLIVGPGNQYVTEAKRQCYGQVGIDFLAGPSEVLVIADANADPRIIAADLLAQSEHDLLAKGILITTDHALAVRTIDEVEKQLALLPTADIASRSWADYGEVIVVDSLEQAAAICNDYAPEHLELMTAQNDMLIPALVNYGSMFIGQDAAEVFGDYVSGSNHALPTLRAARYSGGVWVGTFLKVCTHQSMSRSAMLQMSPLAASLARGEGLIAHARAAEIRTK